MSDRIGIGMLGYAFMGKAHSLAWRDVAAVGPVGLPRPRLVSLWGRHAARAEEARTRYGWERAAASWEAVVDDPDIAIVDNAAPNHLHVEPTLRAAKLGKHLFCEKPLAPTAAEAHQVWRAAEAAGVLHTCLFNYRFMPAIREAKRRIEAGEIGDILHYRSRFLISSSLGEARTKGWRDDKAAAGSGALGDLGSHHIDLCRYLAGEPRRIGAMTRLAVPADRAGQKIETDDAVVAIAELSNGGLATLEASRVAGGHLVTSDIEIDGTRGSLAFSMQRLNELRLAGRDGGFRTIPVERPEHPFYGYWYPAGHPIGWAQSFTHQAIHMLEAVAGHHKIAPLAATFEDGYRCAEVADTILRAAASGRTETVNYRDR